MRPVAHDPTGRLPDGVLAYVRRRARRILPPYYASLALCGLLIAIVPDLGQSRQVPWDRALPAHGSAVIGSHLLLVHNLSIHWLYAIDPPAWCVATEWQIYLVFPFLLMLWRRAGIGAVIAAGFAVGYALSALAGPLNNPALHALCPWYLGEFALGMAAALAAPGARRAKNAPNGVRWVLTGILGLAATVAAVNAVAHGRDRAFVIGDPVVAAVTAGLIVLWARPAPRMRLWSVRFLESRTMLALGTVSYSLFLVHYPLLAWADAFFSGVGLAPSLRLAALVLVVSPLCVPVACMFHRAFKRPFASGFVSGDRPPSPRAAERDGFSPHWLVDAPT